MRGLFTPKSHRNRHDCSNSSKCSSFRNSSPTRSSSRSNSKPPSSSTCNSHKITRNSVYRCFVGQVTPLVSPPLALALEATATAAVARVPAETTAPQRQEATTFPPLEPLDTAAVAATAVAEVSAAAAATMAAARRTRCLTSLWTALHQGHAAWEVPYRPDP